MYMQKSTLVAVGAGLVVLIGAGALVWIGSGEESSDSLWQSAPATSGDNAPPGSIHNLPVPEAVAAVRARVARESSVPESEVLILEAHERQWPDSCLGLAEKNEVRAQVITVGFEVTVSAKGEERVFRTNQSGSVIREAPHSTVQDFKDKG